MHPKDYQAEVSGQGMKFALVVARFNNEITSRLRDGCLRALFDIGVRDQDIETFYVPGSLEIPLAAKLAAKLAYKKKSYDAVIALGAVIRGETSHYDYVCHGVADGVARTAYELEIPVIFGVVTTNNMAQAQARAQNDKTNKGYEAGLAAVEMVTLVRSICSKL